MAVGNEEMAVGNEETVKAGEKRKRTKDTGVRIVGKRIYDSENGKTCHQCRQKTMDFAASCKQLKKDKPCTLKFCHKCLQNRYGENAEQVNMLEEWLCPKCRGVCNCSFCMKKKGQQPTGILYHIAKQIGFNSVHELLDQKGSEFSSFGNVLKNSCAASDNTLPPNKRKVASKGRSRKDKQCVEPEEPCDENIVLPQGRPLTEVAGSQLPCESVGDALQFVEFCKSFSEVLDIKEGESECILKDLVKGPGRRGVSSLVIQFHIKLLSLIEEDIIEGESWVQALGRCIVTEPQHSLHNLSMYIFNKGLSGYDSLALSEKLWILKILCDKCLSLETLRDWIDKAVANHGEKMKENKQKLLAIKREEKLLKQKLSNDMAQAMMSTGEGSQTTASEVKDTISQIRTKADQELAELLKSVEQLPTNKQQSEAAGMAPILLEGAGRAYWKLRSYKGNSVIILQDIGTWDSLGAADKWYIFSEDEEKEVENHISSARNPKIKPRKQVQENSSDDIEEGIDLTEPAFKMESLGELMREECRYLSKEMKIENLQRNYQGV